MSKHSYASPSAAYYAEEARQEDIRAARRAREDDAYLDRLDAIMAREEAALSQVGEICRAGKQVFYVYPQGGKYREGTPEELAKFLVRNKYA